MITKFSVLYVGQIELDNVGKAGTPADERRYPNERLAEAFQTAKEIAAAACYLASEEAGYVTGHTLVIDGGWTAR